MVKHTIQIVAFVLFMSGMFGCAIYQKPTEQELRDAYYGDEPTKAQISEGISDFCTRFDKAPGSYAPGSYGINARKFSDATYRYEKPYKGWISYDGHQYGYIVTIYFQFPIDGGVERVKLLFRDGNALYYQHMVGFFHSLKSL